MFYYFTTRQCLGHQNQIFYFYAVWSSSKTLNIWHLQYGVWGWGRGLRYSVGLVHASTVDGVV